MSRVFLCTRWVLRTRRVVCGPWGLVPETSYFWTRSRHNKRVSSASEYDNASDPMLFGVPAGYAEGNELYPDVLGVARSREYFVGTSRRVQAWGEIVRAIVLVIVVWLVAFLLVRTLPSSPAAAPAAHSQAASPSAPSA